MLAGGGFALAHGAFDDMDNGPRQALGTIDVRVAETVMTYEVFSARGFQSVPASDARPDWHHRPSGGSGPQSSAPQFTFVALPELRARLTQAIHSGSDPSKGLLFDWSDSRWTGPMTLQSPGSQPLPIHSDPAQSGSNGSTIDDTISDLPAGGTDADPTMESGETSAQTGTDAMATAVDPALQADDESTVAERTSRFDQALLELTDENNREAIDFEALHAAREANPLDAAAWGTAARHRAVETTDRVVAFGDRLQSIDSAMLADSTNDLRSELSRLQRERAGSGRYEEFLDRWIVQSVDTHSMLTDSIRNDMIDLDADFNDDLLGVAASYGGLQMIQLFVQGDSAADSGTISEDSSQLGLVFASLVSDNRIASAVAVITVAACLTLRRRQELSSAT